jgi:hypothetical protein
VGWEGDLRGIGQKYLTKTFLVKMMNTTSQIAIVGANVCPIESLDYESFFFSRLIYYWWFFSLLVVHTHTHTHTHIYIYMSIGYFSLYCWRVSPNLIIMTSSELK